MPVPHRLSAKDREALTAVCSVCGEGARIAKNGKYGYVCVVGRRAAKRRWRQAHPEKSRQDWRRPPSQHRLTKRDGSPDTCAVCGPVAPVVMGRGYGCPNRAKELGWKTFPSSPQPACPICRTYLDRFGGCAKCDDDLSDLETAFIPNESRRAPIATLADEYERNGFTIQSFEPWLNDEPESAVPGWKTLGSAEPWKGVKPEYAALFGAGKGKAS